MSGKWSHTTVEMPLHEKDAEVRKFQSEDAKEHGGRIEKDSSTSRLQSEIAREKRDNESLEVDSKSEQARKLQSEFAKGNKGCVSKGSLPAKLQSEADKEINAPSSQFDEHTIARSVLESNGGGRKLAGIDTGHGTGSYVSEDVMRDEEQHMSDRLQKVESEFNRTPHLANTALPSRK